MHISAIFSSIVAVTLGAIYGPSLMYVLHFMTCIFSDEADVKPTLTKPTSGLHQDSHKDVKPDVKSTKLAEKKVLPEQFPAELLASVEKDLLLVLDDVTLNLPVDLDVLTSEVCKARGSKDVPPRLVENLLQKFSAQMLVR